MIAFCVFITASIALTNALTIGRFENITNSAIWDAWNQSNPENVKQGRFAAAFGNNSLWLVSRRLHRKNSDDPWDSAARGGIVSTLRISTNTWTHKPYERLDDDIYGDKVFSLNGRLFMLTYSTNQGKIGYHKLFFWDDGDRWLETPFDIDPGASTLMTNSIVALSVSVPKQDGKVAYVVASAHGSASRGAEMAFSKLDIEFRGNVPIKATSKAFAREEASQPSSVVFTAVKGDTLYAFIHNMYSEGYVADFAFAYTVELKTNRVANVTLSGAKPTMDYDGERMFQTKDQLFIVGGSRVFGLSEVRDVKDIWSLDLNTLQWKGTNSATPNWSGSTPAFDQKSDNLYLAGLTEGVSVARVSA